MNDLGLTHVESLDSDRVTIPGLDIEGDLASTIELGKKKAHRRKLNVIASGFAGLAVLCLALLGVTQLFNETEINTVATTQNKKVETKVKGETQVRTSEAPVTTPATTIVANVIEPKLVPILQYGDASLCKVSSSTASSNGEVQIGSSQSVESWNPAIGGSKTIFAGNPEHEIVLVNTANNNATNGAFVNMTSGFDKNNSFADISTLGFTYCESGYKLTISSAGSGKGYFLNTETW